MRIQGALALVTPPVVTAAAKKCPHCGSDKYKLMPTDFETAKCSKCGKNFDINAGGPGSGRHAEDLGKAADRLSEKAYRSSGIAMVMRTNTGNTRAAQMHDRAEEAHTNAANAYQRAGNSRMADYHQQRADKHGDYTARHLALVD